MAKHLQMSYLWMIIHVLRIIIVLSQQSTFITGFSATIQTKTHYDKASRITTRSGLSSLSAREITRRKSARNQRKGRTTTTRILQSSNNNNAYGRGAEIWPPPSEDEMLLENSFPNGILPEEVVETLKSLSLPERATDNNAGLLPTRRKGLLLRSRKIPRALGRILRRAASAQEETEAEFGTNASSIIMDKTPMFMAAALILSGMVQPLDALLVSFLTGYFVILFLWARSLRGDGITPVMPSLPPQGHVPHLVSNPLGAALTTYSPAYEIWLRVGAVLGLLAPVTLTLRYAVITNQMDCARACARPLFFVCCQAISEAVSRRFLTPLPIRILIPVAYNTVRLGYLWNWVFTAADLGRVGRVVATANLVYWMTNLFGFLLPVATVRYMRAHFFAVEAEQVITRPSMEDSAGVLS